MNWPCELFDTSGTDLGDFLSSELVKPCLQRFHNTGKKQTKRTDWSKVPLGEYHDKVIAEMVGVNTKTVYCARKRRGIPAKGRHAV